MFKKISILVAAAGVALGAMFIHGHEAAAQGSLNSEMCFGNDTRREVKIAGANTKYPTVCKGLCHPPGTGAARLTNGSVLGWGNIPGGATLVWAYMMDSSGQASPSNYCPQDVLHATYQ